MQYIDVKFILSSIIRYLLMLLRCYKRRFVRYCLFGVDLTSLTCIILSMAPSINIFSTVRTNSVYFTNIARYTASHVCDWYTR